MCLCLSLCVQIGLSGVKEGLSAAAGGDGPIVRQPRSTHTLTDPALIFILHKQLVINIVSQTLSCVHCVHFFFFLFLYTFFPAFVWGFVQPPTAYFHRLCLHRRYMFILISSSTEALAHLWSGLIVTTHSFKCFQFGCRLKQLPFKIVSLCFSCGYLAALQLDRMLCISEGSYYCSFEQAEMLSGLYSK